MKQGKEEIVEKCLEAYFYLTVKGEEYCLFQDKKGNLYKPHHKEGELYVFLQESPKTDVITYVKELHRFCTKIVKYDMETKELKITIPEGQEIDWQESAKQEKIVFKKKENTKPRSWEEYCKLKKENSEVGYIIDDDDAHISVTNWEFLNTQDISSWKNALPSRELAEAFLAMMQLMSLRQAWIGDWRPDWRKTIPCIVIEDNTLLTATEYTTAQHVLSFPTLEMAKDFMNCFKDLLEVAKPLI